MKAERRYYLQVPTSIVRGKQFKLDAKTFTVYCYLLHQQFLMHEKNLPLKIDHVKMKLKTYIADNRTLKRCLIKLHDYGIVKEKIEKLSNKGCLHITLLTNNDSGFYTQMPVAILDRLEDIGHVGLHLSFYYESFINRKQINKQFAFPSLRTMRKDLALSFDTLVKYNEVLTNAGILSVVKSELNDSNDNVNNTFLKWNNKYYLMLHKL